MVLRHVSILKDHPHPVTLARYRHTPWGWSFKIETCRSTIKYFYVFQWNQHARL